MIRIKRIEDFINESRALIQNNAKRPHAIGGRTEKIYDIKCKEYNRELRQLIGKFYDATKMIADCIGSGKGFGVDKIKLTFTPHEDEDDYTYYLCEISFTNGRPSLVEADGVKIGTGVTREMLQDTFKVVRTEENEVLAPDDYMYIRIEDANDYCRYFYAFEEEEPTPYRFLTDKCTPTVRIDTIGTTPSGLDKVLNNAGDFKCSVDKHGEIECIWAYLDDIDTLIRALNEYFGR